jgi:DNA-binding MarR family transcriptional regulator
MPSPDPASPQTPEFYKETEFLAQQSMAYLMRRILATLAVQVERALEGTGLTNAQWLPLLILYKGGAVTVADLARACELDAGAMTRLLDRIEAKGLCTRLRSVHDRRVVNLALTPAGVAAAQTIPGVLCGVQNACLAGFTADEWQTLVGLLTRVLGNVQAQVQAQVSAPAQDQADGRVCGHIQCQTATLP